MSEGGADEHADEGDGGVAGALAGQRHLAQRAAAGQRGAEAHGVQAQDVPQVLGVGDGLAIEAKLEAAGDQVEHHHDHEQAGDGEHQVDVADGAGEADADLLRQGADHESGHQGDEHGSVLGARAGLADGEHAGEDADAQADDQQRGQDGAGRLVRVMLAAQGVALLQEERARGNAQDESDEADPGVQEDEGADHHDEAQDESGHGGRTGRGAILARGQGDQERADDQADDLGAEVLHRLGGLQLHGARHVADEARGAHGHIGGVAGEGQKRHSEADQHADQGQALFAVEEIQGSPFLYMKMNRSHSILRRACARAGPRACGDDKAERPKRHSKRKTMQAASKRGETDALQNASDAGREPVAE